MEVFYEFMKMNLSKNIYNVTNACGTVLSKINFNYITGGSGFFCKYNNKLFFITNAHVASKTAKSTDNIVKVRVHNFNGSGKSKVLNGNIHYENHRLDLATIEFPGHILDNQHYLELSSQTPKIGNEVLIVGQPSLQDINNISSGVIRSTNFLNSLRNVLYTDCDTAGGNSGSPIVHFDNDNYKIIGILGQSTPITNQNQFTGGTDNNSVKSFLDRIIIDELTNKPLITIFSNKDTILKRFNKEINLKANIETQISKECYSVSINKNNNHLILYQNIDGQPIEIFNTDNFRYNVNLKYNYENLIDFNFNRDLGNNFIIVNDINISNYILDSIDDNTTPNTIVSLLNKNDFIEVTKNVYESNYTFGVKNNENNTNSYKTINDFEVDADIQFYNSVEFIYNVNDAYKVIDNGGYTSLVPDIDTDGNPTTGPQNPPLENYFQIETTSYTSYNLYAKTNSWTQGEESLLIEKKNTDGTYTNIIDESIITIFDEKIRITDENRIIFNSNLSGEKVAEITLEVGTKYKITSFSTYNDNDNNNDLRIKITENNQENNDINISRLSAVDAIGTDPTGLSKPLLNFLFNLINFNDTYIIGKYFIKFKNNPGGLVINNKDKAHFFKLVDYNYINVENSNRLILKDEDKIIPIQQSNPTFLNELVLGVSLEKMSLYNYRYSFAELLKDKQHLIRANSLINSELLLNNNRIFSEIPISSDDIKFRIISNDKYQFSNFTLYNDSYFNLEVGDVNSYRYLVPKPSQYFEGIEYNGKLFGVKPDEENLANFINFSFEGGIELYKKLLKGENITCKLIMHHLSSYKLSEDGTSIEQILPNRYSNSSFELDNYILVEVEYNILLKLNKIKSIGQEFYINASTLHRIENSGEPNNFEVNILDITSNSEEIKNLKK